MPRPNLDEPEDKLKKQMHNMYGNIFNSSFSERKKINLMTSIHGWEPWSWRVVGITPEAVATIVKHEGRNTVVKEIVRDHYFSGRTKTYKEMLSNFYSYKDWWSEFWKNDRTILMTKKEHAKRKSESYVGLPKEYFKINWKYGYFPCGKVAGFSYAKKYEGDFIISSFGYLIYTNDHGYTLIKKDE
tara:strand:- start:52 stop:609 length:558 start_codon:yes stop_codon:yes gene_type:complete